MKNNTLHSPAFNTPNEAEIRDYAYHLYEQSNRVPARDFENWMEAKACVEARIPAHASHMRLQHYIAIHGYGNIDTETPPEIEQVRSMLHQLDRLRSSLHLA
jgi:Protein of unknown function (DUF2934)